MANKLRASDFRNIVVLTGAGVSAESGISTFRDSGGLWENHRLEDVATPEAFEKDPALVWRFYSARRKAAAQARPNAAHQTLASFARARASANQPFCLVTQNVDMLHERAHKELGAPDPIAMHGSLGYSRCTECGVTFRDDTLYMNELPRSSCCEALLRPHIVWFGEIPIDIPLIETQLGNLSREDLFVTIGTSGNVYPAAGFLSVAKANGATTVCINREPIPQGRAIDHFLQGSAVEIVSTFFGR